jgi:hypothetical protein
MCGFRQWGDSLSVMSTRPPEPQNEEHVRQLNSQKAAHKLKRIPLRTVLIENPAEIAASFANVVTAPSAMPDDWVARNGDNSIFSAFRNVLPEVITSSQPPFDKVGVYKQSRSRS